MLPGGSGSPAAATSPQRIGPAQEQLPHECQAGYRHTHDGLVHVGLAPPHSSQQALWLSASRNISKGQRRAAMSAPLAGPSRTNPEKAEPAAGLSLPGPHRGSREPAAVTTSCAHHLGWQGQVHGLDHKARSFQISFSDTHYNRRGCLLTQLHPVPVRKPRVPSWDESTQKGLLGQYPNSTGLAVVLAPKA